MVVTGAFNCSLCGLKLHNLLKLLNKLKLLNWLKLLKVVLKLLDWLKSQVKQELFKYGPNWGFLTLVFVG